MPVSFIRVILGCFVVIGGLALSVLTALSFSSQLREDVAEVLLASVEDDASLLEIDDADPPRSDRRHVSHFNRLRSDERAVATWLSRKYRVGAEPIAALIIEARDLSRGHQIHPSLMLALAAVESNFSPFAQSEAGAQGIMQIMRPVHASRFRKYGGDQLMFDPIVNFKVGIEILQDCIRLRGGSVEAGLGCYLGGSSQEEIDRYVGKVLAEKESIDSVARSALAKI
jgi:hypothetical protein